MNYIFRIAWCLFFTVSVFSAGYGQTLPEGEASDTIKADQVDIDHSDEAVWQKIDGEEITNLLGNVSLHQKDIFMYCDSAVLRDNNVDATGNVVIQQADSIAIFSDSLSYQGDIKLAHLFDDVSLLKDSQKLFTDYLIYDLNIKRATYYSWAILTNDTTQLRSKRGYYYTEENLAYFKDSVTIVDPNFELKTDTLKYNTKTGVATFLAPTLIIQEDGKIYCEGGFYDTQKKQAHFVGNAQYVKDGQEAEADHIHYDGETDRVTLLGNAEFREEDKTATADTIIYDEKMKLTYLLGNAHVDGEQVIDSDRIIYNEKTEKFETEGRSRIVDGPQILDADRIISEANTAVAYGNVVWVDTVEQVTIASEYLDYNKDTEDVIASGGRPLLISLIDGDSVFMSSDTLVSFHKERLVATDTLTGVQTFEKDSTRTMIAYPDVRILKSDLQAIADSVSYSSVDSLFEFYKNPIIWSDTTQFLADTMYMQLADGKIDRIFLRQDALIINSPDEVYFNQIKGKNITAYFLENELRRMLVIGNAESIYYALDEEKAYVGLNKTVSSKMLMYFSNNSVDDIRFYTQPKANTYPMGQVNHTAERLEGFRWEIDKRPNTLEDLLLVKEKKILKRDSTQIGFLDSISLKLDSLKLGLDSAGLDTVNLELDSVQLDSVQLDSVKIKGEEIKIEEQHLDETKGKVQEKIKEIDPPVEKPEKKEDNPKEKKNGGNNHQGSIPYYNHLQTEKLTINSE